MRREKGRVLVALWARLEVTIREMSYKAATRRMEVYLVTSGKRQTYQEGGKTDTTTDAQNEGTETIDGPKRRDDAVEVQDEIEGGKIVALEVEAEVHIAKMITGVEVEVQIVKDIESSAMEVVTDDAQESDQGVGIATRDGSIAREAPMKIGEVEETVLRVLIVEESRASAVE